MPFALPNASDLRAYLRRVLRPKSKLGKVTLWLGCLAAVLEVLKIIFRVAPGTVLSGWASFISLVFIT